MKIRGTTKSVGKKHVEDKFYTAGHIAELCLSRIDLSEYSVKIEPSAGSGSFSNRVPNCLAFDINPENDSIIKQDWLQYTRERDIEEKILVIGNPPFGVQNNLAIEFINHASKFADTIAFILPRSFRKESVQAKLHPNLRLVDELILPEKSFELLGEPYSLPAVFQVWNYDERTVRPKPVKHIPQGYTFVKIEEAPDFSIQRIGGRAGHATKNWHNKSVNSNYFIKLDESDNVETAIESINGYNFDMRYDAVGPRSISKNELIPILNSMIAS